MKHFAAPKYAEWLAHHERGSFRPPNLREVKHRYRRRERAALKRQTMAMVNE